MVSGLGQRYLFNIVLRGRRCACIAGDSLTGRKRFHHIARLPATERKLSMPLYSCTSICGKIVGQRCYYHNHRFTTAPVAHSKSGKCEVQIVNDGKKLQVVWPGKGGEESTYHATWLKHGCHCPLCWEEATTQHLVWDNEPDPSEITISRAIPTGHVSIFFAYFS